MAARRPDPQRPIADITLSALMRRLASRLVEESGGSELRALADMRAAVDFEIRTHILMARVVDRPPRSWREIGDDLGVSAQAAHRKWGSRMGP